MTRESEIARLQRLSDVAQRDGRWLIARAYDALVVKLGGGL